jgi:hypothetical protein
MVYVLGNEPSRNNVWKAIAFKCNNISVLLVKETGMSGENHQPATKLYHTMLYRVHLAWAGFEDKRKWW